MSMNDAVVMHKPKPVLTAIREKCLDCSCYQPSEVRDCPVTTCALWPFRMGSNPFREKRTLSPDHLAKLQAGRNKSSQIEETTATN